MSLQGAHICCDKELCPEETFLLTLHTLSGPIEVIASVVWSLGREGNNQERPAEMGVRFLWVAAGIETGTVKQSDDDQGMELRAEPGVL